MFTKSVFILAVVCFAATMAGKYVGRKSSPAPKPGGAPGGLIPGGIGECLPFKPFHQVVADFAIGRLGIGYTLIKIRGVRTQVVAGIMYHMELFVSRVTSNGKICEQCDVKVVHAPWMEGQEMTLHSQRCKETCCPIKY
ncbi:uncharacterized protein LOC123529006 isoform X1 [Mercenaria mercenaria]|uniref:uncharacterized protein LOC123529006 isoform X1 n=1 Tax=Mercenaria mercenaria TaxID=6596 RepID=UPI001E1E203C|nr:uncharacterized protein LOC123529006 isoform X1 [Mercenaria mercenaria]